MKVTLIIAFNFLMLSAFSQTLLNGGLEGTLSAGNDIDLPGWELIPYTDPACEAFTIFGATPDVFGVDGPNPTYGFMGNPHNGNSFVSGLHSNTSTNINHEGIQQTVSGFSVNHEYSVSFWQTIIKQLSSNCLDTSGSWAVYLDNTLLQIVPVSISHVAPASTSHIWDHRTVSFIATSQTHVLKFLPMDDDSDHSSDPYNNENTGGALRMGIDDISLGKVDHVGISEDEKQAISVYPSPTYGTITLSAKDGRTIQSVTIINSFGQITENAELNSSTANFCIDGSAGLYFITVRYEDGTVYNSRIQKL